MNPEPDDGISQRSVMIRRWAIRVGIALLVFEAFYVIAANIFIKTDLLVDLINKKPEKTSISWESATTYLPGFFTVKGFTLRSQTKKDQIYLHVAEADARISLFKLVFKTIHIRGVDARDVDFRYRERLDRPPRAGQEDPRKEPRNFEYWPEIPGFSNPPDPKPEELYPLKKKKRPWTIKITRTEVEGPVRVALNDFRLKGKGWVGGGVTIKPRETITIHRGRLGLESTSVTFGPEVVTDNLAITCDIRFESFPAKGAKLPDIIGGISGDLSIAGQLSDKAAVTHVITPGITAIGAGAINAKLRFKKGILRAGSVFSLESGAFHVKVMGLDATGSATVVGGTEKKNGEHVTSTRITFGGFQFVDPEDESVNIAGSGLELNAQWNGLSIAGRVPASHVEVVVPPTQILDVSAFNSLFPAEAAISLQSGTGEIEARLEVNDRIAVGTLDLVAEEIVLKSRDTPLFGDLEVHANLAEGNLPTKEFDLSGTTIRLDNIIDEELSKKKQEKLEAWYCNVELQLGNITFGRPLTADGKVKIKMHDTRPVMAVLKQLETGPKWLSLAPNIKDIDGTMDMDIRMGYLAFNDLVMTGDGFEALGWMHVRDKKTDGRIFVRFKALKAGVNLDQGKAKIILSKPRKWFEEQPKGSDSQPNHTVNVSFTSPS
jgi:hypothetical protein